MIQIILIPGESTAFVHNEHLGYVESKTWALAFTYSSCLVVGGFHRPSDIEYLGEFLWKPGRIVSCTYLPFKRTLLLL